MMITLAAALLIGPNLGIDGAAEIVGRIPPRNAAWIEQDRLWDDYWYSDQQYDISDQWDTDAERGRR